MKKLFFYLIVFGLSIGFTSADLFGEKTNKSNSSKECPYLKSLSDKESLTKCPYLLEQSKSTKECPYSDQKNEGKCPFSEKLEEGSFKSGNEQLPEIEIKSS